MIKQHISLSAIRHTARQAWNRDVQLAYTRREKTFLLSALVVADACLDEVLQAEGYVGETLKERLQSAHSSFSDYSSLLIARKIRNKAVHNLDFSLCWPAVQTALAAYAQALLEHGVDLTFD